MCSQRIDEPQILQRRARRRVTLKGRPTKSVIGRGNRCQRGRRVAARIAIAPTSTPWLLGLQLRRAMTAPIAVGGLDHATLGLLLDGGSVGIAERWCAENVGMRRNRGGVVQDGRVLGGHGGVGCVGGLQGRHALVRRRGGGGAVAQGAQGLLALLEGGGLVGDGAQLRQDLRKRRPRVLRHHDTSEREVGHLPCELQRPLGASVEHAHESVDVVVELIDEVVDFLGARPLCGGGAGRQQLNQHHAKRIHLRVLSHNSTLDVQRIGVAHSASRLLHTAILSAMRYLG
mmetsp:Transcript_34060/g.98111  ORF Transcript_34060/g.98111 Transcript_34060/m.98111 type:complete len:287 (-) Transcript_34060:970-1830(-)